MGYFTDERLQVRLVGDPAHENRPKEIDPATGALRDIRAGACEMYQTGSGSKGEAHSDVSCVFAVKKRGFCQLRCCVARRASPTGC